MSESDSDLEFESADEDTTEHDISEKESAISSVETIEKISDNKSSVIPVTNSHNDMVIMNTNISNIDITADSTTDIPCKNINEGVENISTLAPGKILSEKVDEENKKSKDDISLSSENSSDVKFKQESQRIPLRLEKKVQEKNRLLKESCSEKCEIRPENILVKEEKDEIPIHTNEKSSSWGFGSWGTSLLSTAASSVSTFSSQVSQGIGTVFETVESTLGAPSPEELASILKEKQGQIDENEDIDNKETEDGPALLPDVSSWTKVLESTGSKVIMGGLDTLELIGKKTMHILTESDPGLRNTRHAFSEHVNLSQILREAKEKAEKEAEENNFENTDVNYSQIFDECQGLVHLEALEMLSKQTQAKFQRLLMRHSKKFEVKKKLEEIKSICENIPPLDDPSDSEGFKDFESVFKKHALELNIPLNVDSIVKRQKCLDETMSKFENNTEEPYIAPDEIFSSSICSLADFTARCIEIFHKIAELILVQSNMGSDIEQCATNLTGLATVMCIEINNISSRFHKCLDLSGGYFADYTNSHGLNITAMVTNLYVEASNSNKYIQDAFQMIVPVLQVCLLESLKI